MLTTVLFSLWAAASWAVSYFLTFLSRHGQRLTFGAILRVWLLLNLLIAGAVGGVRVLSYFL